VRSEVERDWPQSGARFRGTVVSVSDSGNRVSDEDRERTVLALRANLIEGRLTLDEFSDRVGLAYSAKVGADLIQITGDLPTGVIRSAATDRRVSRFTPALFAHIVRSGRMRLRRRTTAISVFADIDLDLRQAEIESERTTVNVFAVFGNVDVYVPAGVNVDVGGVTVAGHRRTWGRLTGPQTAPAVYIRGLSLFGTVDVWHVPANMAGNYGEIIRELKRRQGELAT
jgi:Domain of unknown function (DUF1707)/Cell wall-active antibiotics response 4TMS YvqF